MQATLPLSTMSKDFSHQNLRGRNFKGQDLTGANFSHADIRSANFTNTILKGANFSHAKAGLQRRWAIFLVIVSLILSVLSGFVSFFVGILSASVFFSRGAIEITIIDALVFLTVLAVFFLIVTIRQGFGAASVVATMTAAVISTLAFTTGGSMVVAAIAAATAAGAVTLAAGAAAGTTAAAMTVIGKVAATTAATGGVALAATGAVVWALEELATGKSSGWTLAALVAWTVAVGVVAVVLGICIAWRALAGDEKQAFVRTIAVIFGATGGTSFRGADLTDANFNQTILKNTDFSKSNLTRTRFYEARKLNLARVGNSILANQVVLNLLISGNGTDKSYTRANLRGANLVGAHLKNANLKEADISEATFQGANLEWANLTLTQAIGTNFTKAHMTGACMEAWNIENSTKLDNVDCRFVYLLEQPKQGTDDRERRPSSGEFKPGVFTKLFEEVLNTVDLIFDKGIDWKAFVAAFKEVQVENEGTELAIQSIENKGDGVVVVRVSVPPDTNKEKIHSEFTQNYELALKELEKYKELYEYQRKNYSDMHEIVKLLASQSPQINVNNEVTSTSESNPVQETNQYKLRDATVSGSNIGTNHGTQIGTQHNYATKQNLAEAAEDIKKLLQQLEQTYPTNTQSEKMVVVTEAIKQIEDDQTLKQRVLGALKSGGVEAIKELVDHPLINILLAALDGWQTGE